MSASVKGEIVVKDACILFDLLDLGLLHHFYQLKLTVITRPEVLAEIRDETQKRQIQPYIDGGTLQIDDIDVLETAIAVMQTNPGLSLTDASVLETATRRSATILSSDKSLRNESDRRGISVRGLLWVLEELFNQEIIDKFTLIEKLQEYPNVNARAPRKEIEKMMNSYK